jgi:hypothetical protein
MCVNEYDGGSTMYLSRGTFGQLTSKENMDLGSQEDADTPELKFGDNKFSKLGHVTHWCSCIYLHNLNINLEILF